MAAKGAREKIRLVSTAETGHFYTTDKNKRKCLKKWKSKNLIQLCVNTLFIKKQKSNNFARIEKPDIVRVFLYPVAIGERECLNYLKSKPHCVV